MGTRASRVLVQRHQSAQAAAARRRTPTRTNAARLTNASNRRGDAHMTTTLRALVAAGLVIATFSFAVGKLPPPPPMDDAANAAAEEKKDKDAAAAEAAKQQQARAEDRGAAG